MVEILIGVLLLGIGGVAGWFARRLLETVRRGERAPETGAERDIERMRAERQAFEALLSYNAETAYGPGRQEE